MNLLTLNGSRYLVAPRGTTQWVRNLRIAGTGELVLGGVPSRSAPWISDEQKVDILRAYLRRWRFEVGVFFDGVTAKASEAELLRIAPAHPVSGSRSGSADLRRPIWSCGRREWIGPPTPESILQPARQHWSVRCADGRGIDAADSPSSSRSPTITPSGRRR